MKRTDINLKLVKYLAVDLELACTVNITTGAFKTSDAQAPPLESLIPFDWVGLVFVCKAPRVTLKSSRACCQLCCLKCGCGPSSARGG